MAEPQRAPAQDRAESATQRARPGKSRVKRKVRPARAKRSRGAAAATRDEAKPTREETKPARGREAAAPPSSAAAAAQAAAAGADAEIVKEGDTSVKVMKFTGLGIEGRLKSPQLVYFVQRVRAEFERPELPHRSFMPELDRTTAREPVR
jgi:hypothetical protein